MKTTPATAPLTDTKTASTEPPPPRGRPTGYSERVVEMLQEVIRKYGSSDSAAAERLGMAPSSLSRWKRKYPEVKRQLKEAREECRTAQLNLILSAAQAEGGRGWRAAAWLLERLFPADYSPRAADRYQHERLAREQEEREEKEDELREAYEELAVRQEEERAVAEREMQAMTPEARADFAAWCAREEGDVASVDDFQNYRNEQVEGEEENDDADGGEVAGGGAFASEGGLP